MKTAADEHFSALQQIIPEVRRMMLFDHDDSAAAFHPKADNPSLAEWRRKNIENYLLVPEAWRRAVLRRQGFEEANLFTMSELQIIDTFFAEENLTLPPGRNWRNVSANIFNVVDGKRILFEDDNSLFHRLRKAAPTLAVLREEVASNMTSAEIHDDVHAFMAKLSLLVAPDPT